MTSYRDLTRSQLEALLINQLAWFLKYLDGQSSYPVGRFSTGVPSRVGEDYLVNVQCTKGEISFDLQDTAGFFFHRLEIQKLNTNPSVVMFRSIPYKDVGSPWFDKTCKLQCDTKELETNSTQFIEKLVSRIRNKDQVLAFLLGLRLVQEYC